MRSGRVCRATSRANHVNAAISPNGAQGRATARIAIETRKKTRKRKSGSPKKPLDSMASDHGLAERVGFEPTEGLTLRRFSRPVPSTARPSLRCCFDSALRGHRWHRCITQAPRALRVTLMVTTTCAVSTTPGIAPGRAFSHARARFACLHRTAFGWRSLLHRHSRQATACYRPAASTRTRMQPAER